MRVGCADHDQLGSGGDPDEPLARATAARGDPRDVRAVAVVVARSEFDVGPGEERVELRACPDAAAVLLIECVPGPLGSGVVEEPGDPCRARRRE